MVVKNISTLKPGMVLENDIITEEGSKLLPKGIQLTERHISIMKTWGITNISVCESSFSIDADSISNSSNENKDRIKDEVHALFLSFEANALIREFNRIAARFEANKNIDSNIREFSEEWSNR